MILHENKNHFLEFVQKASRDLGIQEVFIEKDYWVTYVLKTLSIWDTEKTVVFKGGTSLSKAYKLIDRFSEDVDLVIKNMQMSPSQIKSKLKDVHKKSAILPLKEVDTERTSKGSRFRKVDYNYPRVIGGYSDVGDASDKLLIELNSFGNPFPTDSRPVRTYIAEMLEQQVDGSKYIAKYQLEAVNLEVLDFRQTFSEKIMGILKASLSNTPSLDIQARIRHLYDITKLLKVTEVQDYIKSPSLVESLSNIYKNDMNIPEFQGHWSNTDLSKNPLFTKTDEILTAIEPHFNTQFKPFLYSREVFEFQQIVAALKELKKVLSPIKLI